MTTSDPLQRQRVARRRFLAAAGGAVALSPFARALASAGLPPALVEGYGPLRPVKDETTGLPLLDLPEGFRYLTFGWAGDALADGTPTPVAHDGMGIVRADGDVLTLVRNHEVVRADGGFGPRAHRYDERCGGGTVTLRFDAARGALIDAWRSLSGTLQNCSGGITPWGTWLSCEEFVGAARRSWTLHSGQSVLDRDHGFVFEVPAEGGSRAVPIVGLGQFRHEAAAVDEASGIVYLTEDMSPEAGFYRFVPRTAGDLLAGGRLQMLAVPDVPDLRTGARVGEPYPVRWVDIPEPARGVTPDGDIRGVQQQGLREGATRFTRLEGCFAGDDAIWFTATDGGDARCGQVFVYHPSRQELVLAYESRDPATLDYPDNVCLSPRGGLVICQDSKGGGPERLHGLAPDGALFELARNRTRLDRPINGFVGDYSGQEWAGACFSPDGRWLFANVYAPGYTVAITGPWRDGLV